MSRHPMSRKSRHSFDRYTGRPVYRNRCICRMSRMVYWATGVPVYRNRYTCRMRRMVYRSTGRPVHDTRYLNVHRYTHGVHIYMTLDTYMYTGTRNVSTPNVSQVETLILPVYWSTGTPEPVYLSKERHEMRYTECCECLDECLDIR